MTAILRDGFEDTYLNPAYTINGTNMFFQTGGVISGYCLRFFGGTPSIEFPIPNLTEFYFRTSLQSEGFPAGINVFQIRNNLGTIIAQVRTGSGSLLHLYVNGSLVASGTHAVTAGSWDRVEFHYKCHASTGVFESRINGVADATFTGNTLPSGSNIASVYHSNGLSNNTYLDDVGVNDLAGSVNNSWCGFGHIVMLLPNGNGSSSQWTGSDGNSTDNYLLVDDPAGSAHDTDSTYVKADVSSLTDDYLMGTYTLVGAETFLNVWSEAFVKKDTGTPPDVQAGIISGSTTVLSSAITPTTSYVAYRIPIQEVDPDTGLAWTQSAIDALKTVIVTL